MGLAGSAVLLVCFAAILTLIRAADLGGGTFPGTEMCRASLQAYGVGDLLKHFSGGSERLAGHVLIVFSPGHQRRADSRSGDQADAYASYESHIGHIHHIIPPEISCAHNERMLE